jgi:hypothetical protein
MIIIKPLDWDKLCKIIKTRLIPEDSRSESLSVIEGKAGFLHALLTVWQAVLKFDAPI